MKRLKTRLLGLLVLNVTDYGLTEYIPYRGGEEANPIMAPTASTIYMPFIKPVVIPALLIFLWKKRETIIR